MYISKDKNINKQNWRISRAYSGDSPIPKDYGLKGGMNKDQLKINSIGKN